MKVISTIIAIGLSAFLLSTQVYAMDTQHKAEALKHGEEAVKHGKMGHADVRRESVTEVMGKLQKAGIIQHSRGHIRILNREGLEVRVCECYRALKKESDRLAVA
ncbi:small metal-binding protein SmbP [Nitrosomonas sp.]|uniref:small metal-binding protein SmbP n=1 Tax=Nitrosomonas sp. TaxID=42353 RepID=UPI0027306F59|nr:small metal-binding protein SmbP [Nitrosomonas sp.]MBK6957800.1 helix-turn-helix domain-containing protein [Nitrosomonas sp.]MDP1788046.1 small metal-binding protein SmbP [Nitrosomonas sp.]MDP2223699.1 small metal-binding protein SmbP [Nitrosomonas sp.]